MILLDGKMLADQILTEIAIAVNTIVASGSRPPHLAAVLVGDDPASQSYVRNKIKSCEKAGYRSSLIQLPITTTQAELLHIVAQLNDDADLDGFIVQLPLPKHIDEATINLAINPAKDVDGFQPFNFGKMAQGLPAFLPATPYGILEILKRYGIETAGKECVVLGRSNIVGTPISILLSKKGYPGDCTVTLAHSRTKNLSEVTRRADILIAAIGRANFVTADMVKEGAVVIDVGINRIEDASTKTGFRLVGDVDFAAVSPKAKAITPVPGGVGPMTVACLMLNTLSSAQQRKDS